MCLIMIEENVVSAAERTIVWTKLETPRCYLISERWDSFRQQWTFFIVTSIAIAESHVKQHRKPLSLRLTSNVVSPANQVSRRKRSGCSPRVSDQHWFELGAVRKPVPSAVGFTFSQSNTSSNPFGNQQWCAMVCRRRTRQVAGIIARRASVRARSSK